MRIGVLGTGVVGRTIATKLVDLGHEVTMGSRDAGNEAAVEWARAAGGPSNVGPFADAASAGELVLNCTMGVASLEALRSAGASNLEGKVLVDVSNPLDFSQGMPPTLAVCNNDSLGEQIQREFPAARVVKALNTMNHEVMVDPEKVGRSHVVFVCGDDDAAKGDVRSLLETFGWRTEAILDLGDIAAARGMEMYLPLWLRIYGSLGTGSFNIAIER